MICTELGFISQNETGDFSGICAADNEPGYNPSIGGIVFDPDLQFRGKLAIRLSEIPRIPQSNQRKANVAEVLAEQTECFTVEHPLIFPVQHVYSFVIGLPVDAQDAQRELILLTPWLVYCGAIVSISLYRDPVYTVTAKPVAIHDATNLPWELFKREEILTTTLDNVLYLVSCRKVLLPKVVSLAFDVAMELWQPAINCESHDFL